MRHVKSWLRITGSAGYYTFMAKEAPISYRPGKDRAAKLAAFAERHGLTKMANVLHRLIDAGLAVDGEPPRVHIDAGGKVRAGPVPTPTGARLVDPAVSRDRWAQFRTPAKR